MAAHPMVKSSIFNYLSKVLPSVVAFAYTILLTTYLGPENYGLYNYIPAVLVGFFSLLGGTFLNNILWTFTARKKSKDFFIKIMIATLILSVLLALSANILSSTIMDFFKISQPELVLIISIFLIVSPVNTIFVALFKGFSKFGIALKAALVENIITLIFIAALVAVLNFGLMGAFIAKILALGLSIAYLKITSKNLYFSGKKVTRNEIKRYGFWNILTNFLREAMKQVELIIMGTSINATLLGGYYLIDKLTKIIISNLSFSMQEIVFSKNSEDYGNKEKIAWYAGKAIRIGFILNLILGALSMVVIPIIILFIFPSFAYAIPYLGIFVLTLLVRSQQPLTGIFDSINETKNNFKISVFNIILLVAVLVPLTYFFSLWGYLVSCLIISELSYFYNLQMLKRYKIMVKVIPTAQDAQETLAILINLIRGTLIKISMRKKGLLNKKH